MSRGRPRSGHLREPGAVTAAAQRQGATPISHMCRITSFGCNFVTLRIETRGDPESGECHSQRRELTVASRLTDHVMSCLIGCMTVRLAGKSA
jgi:hypothetical protein